jgi:hypothetical protein
VVGDNDRKGGQHSDGGRQVNVCTFVLHWKKPRKPSAMLGCSASYVRNEWAFIVHFVLLRGDSVSLEFHFHTVVHLEGFEPAIKTYAL